VERDQWSAPFVEVPHFRPGRQRRAKSLQSGICQAPDASAREHGIDFVNEYLARWQAKIVNLGNRIIGVPAMPRIRPSRSGFFPRWLVIVGADCVALRFDMSKQNPSELLQIHWRLGRRG